MRLQQRLILVVTLFFGLTFFLQAQEASSWTYDAVNDIRVVPNIVYSTANGYDCRLDVYARRKPALASGWFRLRSLPSSSQSIS